MTPSANKPQKKSPTPKKILRTSAMLSRLHLPPVSTLSLIAELTSTAFPATALILLTTLRISKTASSSKPASPVLPSPQTIVSSTATISMTHCVNHATSPSNTTSPPKPTKLLACFPQIPLTTINTKFSLIVTVSPTSRTSKSLPTRSALNFK